MRKFRAGESRNQLALLPRSIEDYVGTEDVVRYVDALVDEFDLSDIESAYSYEGRPAYSPRILVKVLIYGKLRGIRSSRELARACRENVRFMYLAQNERPDFRTIIVFRKRFLEELGGLLKQTIRIGVEEGFIKLEHVAIDGTKIRANAAAKSFKSPKKLKEMLDALEKSFKEDIEVDKEEDDEQGDEDGEPKLPESIRGRTELTQRVRKALERNDQRENSRQYSSTDPEASFIKGPEGIRPSYNAQVAVDASSRMVVGATVTTSATDRKQLLPVLENVKEKTGRNPEEVSADKSYATAEAVVALESLGINGFLPFQDNNSGKYSIECFFYDEEEDEFICPAGRTLDFIRQKGNRELYECQDCSGCALAKNCLKNASRRSLQVSEEYEHLMNMHAKMATPEGKRKLKMRAQTVELLFAWAKAHKKLRQFMFRGLNLVKHEWNFELAALNLERLMKLRMQTT